VKKRIQITLTFSADLDGVPGHDPKDWLTYVREALTRDRTASPRVAFGTVRVVAPTWKDAEARFGREDT
jgi:hypothetical protein